MAPEIHPDQAVQLCILSSQLRQTHHAFLTRKTEKAKASMPVPTRPREFRIQEENCDRSLFTFSGLPSHHWEGSKKNSLQSFSQRSVSLKNFFLTLGGGPFLSTKVSRVPLPMEEQYTITKLLLFLFFSLFLEQ